MQSRSKFRLKFNLIFLQKYCFLLQPLFDAIEREVGSGQVFSLHKDVDYYCGDGDDGDGDDDYCGGGGYDDDDYCGGYGVDDDYPSLP